VFSLYLAHEGYHFVLIIQQLSMTFDCGFFITLINYLLKLYSTSAEGLIYLLKLYSTSAEGL